MNRRRMLSRHLCVCGIDLRGLAHGGVGHLAGCLQVAPWIRAWALRMAKRQAGLVESPVQHSGGRRA